jgi:hypothetical protein
MGRLPCFGFGALERDARGFVANFGDPFFRLDDRVGFLLSHLMQLR